MNAPADDSGLNILTGKKISGIHEGKIRLLQSDLSRTLAASGLSDFQDKTYK